MTLDISFFLYLNHLMFYFILGQIRDDIQENKEQPTRQNERVVAEGSKV